MTRPHQNLKEYYQSLSDERGAKAVFQREIMKVCECSISTAQNWCTGLSEASKYNHLRALSELTGIPINNLFKTV